MPGLFAFGLRVFLSCIAWRLFGLITTDVIAANTARFNLATKRDEGVTMKIVSVVLFIVGVIHLLPAKGVLGSDVIAELYGVSVVDQDAELLMRHRAVLFGLLGAFMIFAAFQVHYQAAALVAGLVSTVSFVVLSWLIGKPGELVFRVVIIDWIAVALLVVAVLALAWKELAMG